MELTSADLSLRINDIEYTEVELSYIIQEGFLSERREVLIKDPRLGIFAITADFVIEVRQGEGPWMKVTLATLIAMLEKEKDTAKK